MKSLPVCPYCDTEVPSHIFKAHMALCSDSQRPTPTRTDHRRESSVRVGLGYYATLTGELPAYTTSHALEEAALDALLSPKTDTSQLLQSLVGSQSSTFERARASGRSALPSSQPLQSSTNVSTALFPPVEPGHASRGLAAHAEPAAGPSPTGPPSRRGSSLIQSRESTRRPSPLTAGDDEEVVCADGTHRKASAMAAPVFCSSQKSHTTSLTERLPDNERERLAFLELTCEELRQSISWLKHENARHKERHDVLEEALYSILHEGQQTQGTWRPVTSSAMLRALPETRCLPSTTHFTAELGDAVWASQALPQSAPVSEAHHYSDIGLLRSEASEAVAFSQVDMAPRPPARKVVVNNGRAWTDMPSNYY